MKRNKRPMKTKQNKKRKTKIKRVRERNLWNGRRRRRRTTPLAPFWSRFLFYFIFFLVVSLRLFNQLDEIKLKLTNPNQININHPTNQTTDECSWRFPLAIPEPSWSSIERHLKHGKRHDWTQSIINERHWLSIDVDSTWKWGDEGGRRLPLDRTGADGARISNEWRSMESQWIGLEHPNKRTE